MNWELMLQDLSDAKGLIRASWYDAKGGACAVGTMAKKALGLKGDEPGQHTITWESMAARYNMKPAPNGGLPIFTVIMRANDSCYGTDEERLAVVRTKIQEMRDMDEEYQAKLRTQARDSIVFSVLEEEKEKVCKEKAAR